jgi:hypothetical protein
MHKEIFEARRSGSNRAGLGLPLSVKIENGSVDKGVETAVFEDLDELAATFIEPLVEKLRAVHGHRKFKTGDDETVRGALCFEVA